MDNDLKKYIKMIVIIGVIIGIILGIYYLYVYFFVDKDEYVEVEQYEANQYYPVYITEDQMANIYLSDFNNLITNNLDAAYQKLNKDYREKKFGSINNFKNYISSLGNISIKSFAIKNSNGFEYFYIYDTNNNLYIFKTDGVMQYEIFFDENTVEI